MIEYRVSLNSEPRI